MLRSAVNIAFVLLLGAEAALAEKTQNSAPAKRAEDSFEKVQILKKGEKALLEGKVFYSEPIRFDYDKDGTKNSVVMASRFFIKIKQDGTYDGYIQRFLYDIDKKRAVSWYSKKNMLQEPPIGIDTAVSNVKHKGATVEFDSGNWHFIMTDGGEGYISDKIVVSDGIRSKEVVMFGGDVKVMAK